MVLLIAVDYCCKLLDITDEGPLLRMRSLRESLLKATAEAHPSTQYWGMPTRRKYGLDTEFEQFVRP